MHTINVIWVNIYLVLANIALQSITGRNPTAKVIISYPVRIDPHCTQPVHIMSDKWWSYSGKYSVANYNTQAHIQ